REAPGGVAGAAQVGRSGRRRQTPPVAQGAARATALPRLMRPPGTPRSWNGAPPARAIKLGEVVHLAIRHSNLQFSARIIATCESKRQLDSRHTVPVLSCQPPTR